MVDHVDIVDIALLYVIVERRRQHSGKSSAVEMQLMNVAEFSAACWTPSQTCGLSTPPSHLTSTGQQYNLYLL